MRIPFFPSLRLPFGAPAKASSAPMEAERRFLVNDSYWELSVVESHRIEQGYLSDEQGKIIRAHTQGLSEGYLTITSFRSNATHEIQEYGCRIPVEDAQQLISLCGSKVIRKIRSIVPLSVSSIKADPKGVMWEIDDFRQCGEVLRGDAPRFVIAKIRLPSINYAIENLPEWVGAEITADQRYSNRKLANLKQGDLFPSQWAK